MSSPRALAEETSMKASRRILSLLLIGSLAIAAVLIGLAALNHSATHPVTSGNIASGDQPFRLVGAVAVVHEQESDLPFQARVDTGAKRCSLHVSGWKVLEELPKMVENIGKTIRFRLENRQGQSS